MLQFSQSDTNVDIIVTLQEFVTLTTPNYLFVFTHVTTKEVVAFVKLNNQNTSLFQTRYDKFNLNPSALFSTPGEWHYKVYEQASNSNTDPLQAGTLLEQGKLILDKSPAFDFTKYDTPTSYKTYAG